MVPPNLHRLHQLDAARGASSPRCRMDLRDDTRCRDAPLLQARRAVSFACSRHRYLQPQEPPVRSALQLNVSNADLDLSVRGTSQSYRPIAGPCGAAGLARDGGPRVVAAEVVA